MYFADLHIHSKYARATSRDCDIPHLELWARRKGIALIGTGDFTHPAYRAELREQLEADGGGFYTLKSQYRLEPGFNAGFCPQFVISGEISCIYKRGGRVRKVHNLILLPSLEAADKLSWQLEAVGNIRSDGRPILGLDSEQLLKLTLESCPDAIFIPAHIWTPHFSMLGAFSGFESVEQCFGELSKHIYALETGLSSDPAMNWQVSALDRYTLVSNSDAHSPQKLGREANMLSCEMSYRGLKRALETGAGFEGTVEFFPDEGKYHMDGHRACGLCLTPSETEKYGGICPICGKKITVGVEHRVMELADRPQGFKPQGAKAYKSLIPLVEVIADGLGVSPSSKKAQSLYFKLVYELGPEFYLLTEAELSDIEAVGTRAISAALQLMRKGEVIKQPGFDGQYGIIRLLTDDVRQALMGQTALFGFESVKSDTTKSNRIAAKAEPEPDKEDGAGLNDLQQRAAESESESVMVIAGPGTGKTRVLIQRAAYLIEKKGVAPKSIAAVTFTQRAAAELRARLSERLGSKTAGKINVGTFHALALSLLQKQKPVTVISRCDALGICKNIIEKLALDTTPTDMLYDISRYKNTGEAENIDDKALKMYESALSDLDVVDFDDLMDMALGLDTCFAQLLVDEFQDINQKQFELTLKWSKGGGLFVIGDPNQAIYGFRGAKSEYFDKLKPIYDFDIITLEDNYRSSPQILAVAAGVYTKAPKLLPHQPDGIKVQCALARDGFSQSVFAAREISRLTGGMGMLEARQRQSGEHFAFSDIAVLCRTHRQLNAVEKALRASSIPCVLAGGDDFLSDAFVGGTAAFFTLVCGGNLSALAGCLKGAFGAPADIAAVVSERVKKGASSVKAAVSGFESDYSIDMFLKAYARFLPVINKSPAGILHDFAEFMGAKITKPYQGFINSSVFDDSMPDFLNRLEGAGQYDIMRMSGGDRLSGAVRLITMHAAKGLEFGAVFVMGLDGEYDKMLSQPGTDTDEELRLLYVALTRASRELIITGVGSFSAVLDNLSPKLVKYTDIPDYGAKSRYRQLSLF